MRIAVVNWSRRRAGGVETYLGGIVPELFRAGNEVAFWYEVDRPRNRERIALPAEVPVWSVEELGAGRALAALAAWRPDLIYAHGLLDPRLEEEVLKVAPAVFFAHSYYGTCISGAKTFKRPVVRPCDRRFGWRCLVHYYPRRCGGLNPLTMLKEYARQSMRLEVLRAYSAIVTHSSHLRSELIKHGLAANSAYKFDYYVHGSDEMLTADEETLDDVEAASLSTIQTASPSSVKAASLSTVEAAAPSSIVARSLPVLGQNGGGAVEAVEGHARGAGWRLLFLGRMDVLKGGGVMLRALPRVLETLGGPVHVTMAGDGPARREWERLAARLPDGGGRLKVEFTGWLDGERVEALLASSDLLVLPSLWPEPFGLVGPEAGLRGVPIAAFGVGGIPDWLVDGVNGRIAHGDPPTAEGLVAAINGCLGDPATHAAMKRGAVRLAQRFNMKNHLAALMDVFDAVVNDKSVNAARRARV